MKKNIVMIVLNSIMNDARVMKEAHSLKSIYNVTIVGIGPANYNTYFDDGIDIKYVAKTANGFIGNRKLLYGILGLISTLVVLNSVLHSSTSFTFTKVVEVFHQHLFVWMNTILILLFTCFFIKAIYRRESLQRITKVAKEIIRVFTLRKSIFKAVKEIEPDVIHAHDLNSLVIGHYCKKKCKCLLVYDSHEIYTETSNTGFIRRIFFTFVENYLSKDVDDFITINDSIASYLNDKYKRLPKAVIVKNACRCVLPDRLIGCNKIRHLLKLPDSINIVLYQGGIVRHRGLEYLLKAANYLCDKWVIVFMGKGKFLQTLEKLAQHHATLNKKVYFIPEVDQKELVSWTASATIGVIPYENVCLNHLYCTPNKLWEYPLASIPFLANPLTEIRKVLAKGVGWPIYNLYVPNAFAEQINNLRDEDINRAKQSCVKFIQENNWESEEEKLVNLYKGLV